MQLLKFKPPSIVYVILQCQVSKYHVTVSNTTALWALLKQKETSILNPVACTEVLEVKGAAYARPAASTSSACLI